MKLAINGFGRIGRAVPRIIAERPSAGIEIVAVNDLAADDSRGAREDQRLREPAVIVAGHLVRVPSTIRRHDLLTIAARDPAVSR